MSVFHPKQTQDEAYRPALTEGGNLSMDEVCSSSSRYAADMIRLGLILPLALAACSTGKVALPPTQTDVRPIVAKDDLRGRWTINSVNGRQGNGLWLELGGEGPGTVTKTENGLLVGSPLPRTQAHLGCNDFRPNGWTRNGDKLTLGVEMSRRTERGCDAASEALDDEAYGILRRTMNMEFTPPDRLRLINENGTLELVRNGS